MRLRSSAILVLLWFVGCDRPSPVVLCHNGNCVSPHDVARDDTIDALRESLALRHEGRPTIDGLEVDLLWHKGRCLFSHGVEESENASGAEELAAVIAEHLRSEGPVSFGGNSFTIFFELKVPIDPVDDRNQAGCAIDTFRTVRDAAVESGRELEVIFDSFEPRLLGALQEHPDRPRSEPGVTVGFSFDLGPGFPIDTDNHRLGDFAGLELDVVELHGGWITDTAMQALRQLGLEFCMLSYDLTIETLDAIDVYDPTYVVVSNAEFMRQWIER